MSETGENTVAPEVVRRLVSAAVIATVLLTVAAFWLSYAHLHTVADGHGLSGSRAWAWPGTIDLFIFIGEILILVASVMRRTDAWAIAVTIIGSVGSVALNVAGVGPNAPGLNYVVAAVPPLGALLAFGLLMRQIKVFLTRPNLAAGQKAESRVASANQPSVVPNLPQVQAPEPVRANLPTEVPNRAANPAVNQVPNRPEPVANRLPNLTGEPAANQVQAVAEPAPNPAPEPAEPNPVNLARTKPKTAKPRTAAKRTASATPTNPDTPAVLDQVQQILDLIEEHGYDTVKLGFVMEHTGLKKTAAYNGIVEARAKWQERQDKQPGDTDG